MCACVAPPPYMLGERSTPLHGGSGAASFRQVPFVRVSERVESGIKVRKQLRKYLKTSSTTQHLVAQMHLNDACVTAMQPSEVAQSCFESFFAQMKLYNQVVGQKHLEASKAMLEMARPLDNAGKSKKWARDVYNLVQRCVQDVTLAEKKMDKAKTRKERGDEDLAHWKRVLEANEATYQVQPNNPEVQRAYQLAQYRFANAFAEEEAATGEFEDARAWFYASIERRDQVVEEATELSQSLEEDRLETMLIVMKQFIETKKAILQAEFEAVSNMQRILQDMDRESVIQQYIVDAMQPDLTHRHAKALYLLEWHRTWHHEQVKVAASEPTNYLALSPDDAVKIKSSGGISSNDVEVVKDFVMSCFVDPDRSILAGKPVSAKHRNRFTDTNATAMYRLPVVRKIFLHVLHHQRTHSLELSADGHYRLATALRLLLTACYEADDATTIKSVMNMAQTFYYTTGGSKGGKEYLLAPLLDHVIWDVPQYWGNALLLSIGEELSKNAQNTPWYYLSGQERAQLVLHVHNMVYGQVTAFVYSLQAFGFSRRQILQYVQNVCFAYELAEDQRISLLTSVDALPIDERAPARCNAEGEEVQFTSLTLPDWTYLCGGMNNVNQKFRLFRRRTPSTGSEARSSDDPASNISNGGSAKDLNLEDMKQRASAMINLGAAPSEPQESWQDLFGSTSNGSAHPLSSSGSQSGASLAPSLTDDTGSVDGDSERPKRNKARKNSRRFNEQPRIARGQSLGTRISGEDTGAGEGGYVSSTLAPASLEMPAYGSNTLAQLHVPPGPASALVSPSNAYGAPMVGPHTVTARAHGGRKQSVDDSALLLNDERASNRQRHSRMHKARSAATIDTSDFGGSRRGDTEFGFAANTPLPPTPTPTTGMDHIKTIAKQMKKRREAAGGLDPTARSPSTVSQSSRGLSGVAAPSSIPPSKKPLRRSQSSAVDMESDNGTGNGASSDDAAAPAEAALSGVAALRARFEKK